MASGHGQHGSVGRPRLESMLTPREYAEVYLSGFSNGLSLPRLCARIH